MKFADIYDSLLNESYHLELEKVEKFLKVRIKKESYNPLKQELILLLLICLLKKNRIETNQMRLYFLELIDLIKYVERDSLLNYSKNS
jgi:hypothetical protein